MTFQLPMTKAQQELQAQHGTLDEFEIAVWDALGEISVDEARAAISKYEREWDAAGMNEDHARKYLVDCMQEYVNDITHEAIYDIEQERYQLDVVLAYARLLRRLIK